MPVHLRPSAPTAPSALICGDPARALAIAQRVLSKPQISNHHRGLWGYHGETHSGLELTIQSTGIGGPSAAIVLGELADLGLRAAIRIGTCASLTESLPLGAGIVVGTAIGRDGTSSALGAPAGMPVHPDPELTRALSAALPGEPVAVVSRDLPTDWLASRPDEAGDRAEVADLQSASVLVASRNRGISAAILLAVSAVAARRLEDEPLEAQLLRLADVGVESLNLNSRLR